MEKTLKEAADSLLQKNKITNEEYDSLDIEKNGAFPVRTFISQNMASFGKGLNAASGKIQQAGAAAVTLATAGYLAKELIADPAIQAAKLNNSYNQLMAKTPQLQNQDPNTVRDYFNIVKTYSPAAASNPIVAGALVNKMIEFGGVDHKLIMDLMSMQEKVPSLGAMPLFIGAGAKTLADPDVTSINPKPGDPKQKINYGYKSDSRGGSHSISFEKSF